MRSSIAGSPASPQVRYASVSREVHRDSGLRNDEFDLRRRLGEALAEMTLQSKAAEDSRLRNAALEEKLRVMEKETRDHLLERKVLENAKKDLASELQHARAENERLQQAFTQLDRAQRQRHEQSETLLSQLEEARTETRQATAKSRGAVQALENFRQEYEALSRENGHLASEMQNLSVQLDKSRNEARELQAALDAQNAELQNLRVASEEARREGLKKAADLGAVADEKAFSLAENRELKKKLAQAKAEIDSLNVSQALLLQTQRQLNADFDKLKAKAQALQNEMTRTELLATQGIDLEEQLKAAFDVVAKEFRFGGRPNLKKQALLGQL